MSGIIVKTPKPNAQRGFAEATRYVPCWVRSQGGEWVPALFTERQIETACERAAQQPEDTKQAPSLVARLLAKWL
jgi:hypothetical protein